MKCSKAGCEAHATCLPVLSFTAKGYSAKTGPRAFGEMELPLCDEHAVPNVDDFLTEEGWQKIEDGLRRMGKAQPNRASARIEFRSLPRSAYLDEPPTVH